MAPLQKFNGDRNGLGKIFRVSQAVADLRGRQGRAPRGGPNSFIFTQFSAKDLQNNSLAHPLCELVPPLRKILPVPIANICIKLLLLVDLGTLINVTLRLTVLIAGSLESAN